MTRYPFTDCIKEFMPTQRGYYEDITYDSVHRKLKHLGEIVEKLKAEGSLTTSNPKKFTARDIDVIVGYRNAEGCDASTIRSDLKCLEKMLLSFDNNAVEQFKIKYPSHFPVKHSRRHDPLEQDQVDRILSRAKEISPLDWKMTEGYALVTLAICTGLRPKELRQMYVYNVHIGVDSGEIYAEHVKGEGTYGSPRWIPIHPDGLEILSNYLNARRMKLEMAHKKSDALFPPLRGQGEFIGYNQIEKLKLAVEKDVGEKFDYRTCRRTFGQVAIDEGHDIHNVSKVLGHSTIVTTQRHYCDKSEHSACREMMEKWRKDDPLTQRLIQEGHYRYR
ncbi:MAG: site-specific integrase [Candidatus Methanomethylophilaceae archaeon]|nr:site-specific integrase [Candidatus Methanomethylophilaceae archaeon]